MGRLCSAGGLVGVESVEDGRSVEIIGKGLFLLVFGCCIVFAVEAGTCPPVTRLTTSSYDMVYFTCVFSCCTSARSNHSFLPPSYATSWMSSKHLFRDLFG